MKTFSNIQQGKLNELAAQLFIEAGNTKIWAFYGEMGAGKTTLIKAICSQASVVNEVSSPTFSLVNEYHTKSGDTIYHFDFYRLKSIEEAFDIGYESYFFSGSLCLIEWPEKIDLLLQDERVFHIELQKKDEQSREIRVW